LNKVLKVKHEDNEMTVIIPDTGDKKEMEYIEAAEREKTLNQLKKKPKREKSKVSNEDKAGVIKEFQLYREKRSINPRFYNVGSYTS